MTVKTKIPGLDKEIVLEYLSKYGGSSTIAISKAIKMKYCRVWNALTQLEMKGLVKQENKLWWAVNEQHS